MKKIFIIHSNMEIGGAETSLLGLLKSIDYKNYSVDLLLLNPIGELMSMIPKEVNILSNYKQYKKLQKPIKELFRKGNFGVATFRLIGKIKAKIENKKLNN